MANRSRKQLKKVSDVIRLLPDSVANQIAAGEVIQRPSSIVKELVENAVDAGATEISINVVDAGKTMLQVIDNGCGMSETDARMAFERHATSKIRQASDLCTLRTMGFRGEALPSVCAVSEVELRTRTADSALGTRLVICGSKVESQEPCACERGTVMTVRKLFYNVPARRKFLKSDSVELAAIMREFERLALVNNNVRMSINTGTRQIQLRNGTFRQRIGELWKNNLNEHLLPVDVDTSVVKIEGFISPPQNARRRNPLQFLIVNGRNMRHPYFHKSIVSCFDNLIATDTQPNYFIKLTVDPETIDVNIHPTKNEIKFENEQVIRPILVAAVKASLGKFSAVPSIDFESDAIEIEPVAKGELPDMPGIENLPGYNPFNIDAECPQSYAAPADDADAFRKPGSGRSFASRAGKRNYGTDWQKLYEEFSGREYTESAVGGGSDESSDAENRIAVTRLDLPDGMEVRQEATDGGSLIDRNEIEISPVCMQVDMKYIVTTSHRGLIIIDQYRAHEKILYERFLSQIRGKGIVSQTIMFPEEIRLDEMQQTLISSAQGRLTRLGFSLEYEEEDRWKINSAPSLVKSSDYKEIIYRILELTSEEGDAYGAVDTDEESLYQTMARAMARAAAVTGGVKLTTSEMEHLVAELFSLSSPAYTPEGNPVFCVLDESRLQSMFR